MSAVQPQIVQQAVGDTELTYLAYDGNGPPVLFLHAAGFMPWLWPVSYTHLRAHET